MKAEDGTRPYLAVPALKKARSPLGRYAHRLPVDADEGLRLQLGERGEVDFVLQVKDGLRLVFLAAS